ncbi:hypothetical protein AFERRID_03860 [Acidithiobacillus ferridurans]|uniref:Uncharacterized protein n=1 Tax=Acidithiobacillus ferridurans TaxID=1232575 RepID=A0A2Z6IEW6_ACIFI|nr:hypothetical protein AFERRID_03860 [Acidithiobacillus ferridurans]
MKHQPRHHLAFATLPFTRAQWNPARTKPRPIYLAEPHARQFTRLPTWLAQHDEALRAVLTPDLMLKIALLEKTGHNHGVEHVLSANPQAVCLASARHPTRVTVTGTVDDGYQVYFETNSATLPGELARCFPGGHRNWTAN